MGSYNKRRILEDCDGTWPVPVEYIADERGFKIVTPKLRQLLRDLADAGVLVRYVEPPEWLCYYTDWWVDRMRRDWDRGQLVKNSLHHAARAQPEHYITTGSDALGWEHMERSRQMMAELRNRPVYRFIDTPPGRQRLIRRWVPS